MTPQMWVCTFIRLHGNWCDKQRVSWRKPYAGWATKLTAVNAEKAPKSGKTRLMNTNGNNFSTSPEASSGEPMKRVSIDVPESLHTRFKVVCARTKSKMASEIVAFIEKRVSELEDEKQ